MRAIDYTFHNPHENLAFDEVLLRETERDASDDVLRFWESPVPFVVLGLTQRICDEVKLDACNEDGIPITRRCSAGGCVLQGPGCLNFTLILAKAYHPEIVSLHESYAYILSTIRDAIGHTGVGPAGISDLAFGDRKISGNAQRRRKNHILHHGTLLYDADLTKIQQVLHEPADRPDYRGDRRHEDFVTNLDITRDELTSAIMEQFGVDTVETEPDARWLEFTHALAEEKYSTREWVYRK